LKYLTATAVLIFFCFNAAVSNADKLYIWTDKSGETHITQEPPPEGVQSNSVIDYTPQPEKEVKRYEQQQQIKFETQRLDQRRQEALAARKKADAARREAQQARIEADTVTRKAQEYIDTHNRNQYMRRAFKYERRKAAEEADAAQEKAREAEKRAQAAEEEAQLAAQRLQQALQQTPQTDQNRGQ
jgi:hypothetical protein